jgi:hypothetical protein
MLLLASQVPLSILLKLKFLLLLASVVFLLVLVVSKLSLVFLEQLTCIGHCVHYNNNDAH